MSSRYARKQKRMRLSDVQSVITGGLFGLLFLSVAGNAKLSDPSGRIHGHAPVVTGTAFAMHPDGLTPVEDGHEVPLTLTPGEFSVSPDTSEMAASDADGDIITDITADLALSSLVWKYNGTPLTPAQVGQAFYPAFEGKTLLLEVGARITATTQTGLPNTGTNTVSSPYLVRVANRPLLHINGASFRSLGGEPRNAFAGATFQFFMNGTNAANNGDYTWSADQSWVSVDTTGKVTLLSQPDASHRTVTLTATPKTSGRVMQYSFTPQRWFVNLAHLGRVTIDTAKAQCIAAGGAVPSYTVMVNRNSTPRALSGLLFAEWGDMSAYGQGWLAQSYWTAESEGGKDISAHLKLGATGTADPGFVTNVACVYTL